MLLKNIELVWESSHVNIYLALDQNIIVFEIWGLVDTILFRKAVNRFVEIAEEAYIKHKLQYLDILGINTHVDAISQTDTDYSSNLVQSRLLHIARKQALVTSKMAQGQLALDNYKANSQDGIPTRLFDSQEEAMAWLGEGKRAYST